MSDRVIDNRCIKHMRIRIKHAHSVYEPYEPGNPDAYIVTPKPYDEQILETKDKVMEDNITVKKIPYYSVSNPEGGLTATIGINQEMESE